MSRQIVAFAAFAALVLCDLVAAPDEPPAPSTSSSGRSTPSSAAHQPSPWQITFEPGDDPVLYKE